MKRSSLATILALTALMAGKLWHDRMDGKAKADILKGKLSSGPEARAWLSNSKHPSALASNRFEETVDALKFVELVYSLGATKVVIDPEAIRPEPHWDGEYADAIIVQLPEHGPKRDALLELFENEAARDGYILGPEIAYGVLFSWWD